MKLVCPACGAIASAEIWLNDALCRDAFAAVAGLPAPLPKTVLGYLGLFRPSQTGLTWKKSLRLATEISALTACGYVSVQGRVDRPCPPRVWAQAMEQMVERRQALSLPLKNHNYLRQVAWQIADQEDAQNEKSSHASPIRRQTGAIVITEQIGNISSPLDQYIQGLRESKPSDEEMALWKRDRG